MERLNYHHLHCFYEVAREGGITQAARKIRITPSTLSSQVKQLEDFLGIQLFDRRTKRMILTEEGKLVFRSAEQIFEAGNAMIRGLNSGPEAEKMRSLRIGALAGLSKNLQFALAESQVRDESMHLVIRQGPLSSLIRDLEQRLLDVVISDFPVRADQQLKIFSKVIGKIPIVAVGAGVFSKGRKNFREWLLRQPLFLPSFDSQVRIEIDRYFDGAELKVRAEVEDIALLRLFALSGKGVAILPQVAVAPDIAQKRLQVYGALDDGFETIYALTSSKAFRNPDLEGMVKAFERRLLGHNSF